MQGREDEISISDVKCYFCGHVSGQIVAVRARRPAPAWFVPEPRPSGEPPTAKRLRCARCNGPVFFEEISPSDLPTERARELEACLEEMKQAA